jgi:hypothetical protein
VIGVASNAACLSVIQAKSCIVILHANLGKII